MWGKTLKSLAEYPSGVLTAIDSEGYPFSLRCTVEADSNAQVLYLNLAPHITLPDGLASILFHYHDEQLWGLKNFVLRGRLEKSENGYFFRPSQYIDGAGTTLMHQFRVIQNGRKAAKQYLQKRGLERPGIPWDEVKALYKRAQKA